MRSSTLNKSLNLKIIKVGHRYFHKIYNIFLSAEIAGGKNKLLAKLFQVMQNINYHKQISQCFVLIIHSFLLIFLVICNGNYDFKNLVVITYIYFRVLVFWNQT